MAVSRAESLAGGLLLGLWGVVVAAQPATAPPQVSDQPISLNADSSDFDYKNNLLLFRRVTISQGELKVEAEQANATGLNFENSRWIFRGKVRITVPDGVLTSDDATVTFVKNSLAKALVNGSPASFEQRRRKDNGLARGRAQHIEYDVGAETVRLTDEAWLTDGTNEITGRTLVYRMGDQRVVADADDQGRQPVRIMIKPRGGSTPATTATPAPTPAPKPPADKP
jgi:lipopolysaccharide export system protein LptA